MLFGDEERGVNFVRWDAEHMVFVTFQKCDTLKERLVFIIIGCNHFQVRCRLLCIHRRLGCACKNKKIDKKNVLLTKGLMV